MKNYLCYQCDDCFERYEYPENTDETEFLCPKCGQKMWYWGSYEMDETTNKCVNIYKDEERRRNHPARPSEPTVPVVTCPYCHSTNTERLTGFARLSTWSFLQWHCNTCGSDF